MKTLFQPFVLKDKRIKNRCVVPAMVTNSCTEDSMCTEQFIAYHEKRARGGFGMIITENFAVDPLGKAFKRVPGLWHDGQIAGFREFTERIHKNDTVLIAQIYHAGRQTDHGITGHPPLAPSAIPDPLHKDMPEVLTIQEIRSLVVKYGDCARRAKEAGFDGVEIHGAHGYLIAQFMSSYSNTRTDEYGGSFMNRIRFALEVIRDVRAKCGEDFIVGYRISGQEFVEFGRTIRDTQEIAPYLEEEGIDYIHVSAGVYGSIESVMPSMYYPHAWLADHAAKIKEVTSLPVITVGRYNDPRIADEVLAEGKADFIAFGKQSLCDPETPNKAKEGRFDDIRKCVGCLRGCLGSILSGGASGCDLNPETGREAEIEAERTRMTGQPSSQAFRVCVIGAGPAGLSAAISAAKSGHEVSVYEKSLHAGGQYYLAFVPPHKEEIADYICWQLKQILKLKVPVFFGVEATEELIAMKKPDLVIAATGALPKTIELKGQDKIPVFTAHEVLGKKAETGRRILVIGGGCVGAETANYLASLGKDVLIVEKEAEIAVDEAFVVREELLADLKKRKVRIYNNARIKEVVKEGAVITEMKTLKDILLPVDTIVQAVGLSSDTALAGSLKKKGYPVLVIGDALKPGTVGDAVYAGWYAGNHIDPHLLTLSRP